MPITEGASFLIDPNRGKWLESSLARRHDDMKMKTRLV